MSIKKRVLLLVKNILGERGKVTYFGCKLFYFKLLSKIYKKSKVEYSQVESFPTYSIIREKWNIEASAILLDLSFDFELAFDNRSLIINDSRNLELLLFTLRKKNFKFSNNKSHEISTKHSLKLLRSGQPIFIYKIVSYQGIDLFSAESSIALYPNSQVALLDESTANLYDFDVDIVYTWVDGEDAKWLESKKLNIDDRFHTTLNSANSKSRFRSRDELKYSIRSVAMYADWVRNIYIVTDSQVPSWLKECDKVSIIDHREVFPDKTMLPVFNSHAIEACLHRIRGLSECFLYFNDDVFLGQRVEKSDFFYPFGKLSRCFYSNQTYIPPEINENTLPVDVAAINNAKLLDLHYGYKPTRKFKHTPIALKRSILEDLESKHPDVFQINRISKIRSEKDYSIVSALHHHYGIIKGKVSASSISYDYINLGDPSYRNKLGALIYQPARFRRKCFCINDVNSDHLCQDEISNTFSRLIEKLYPFKSPYEI